VILFINNRDALPASLLLLASHVQARSVLDALLGIAFSAVRGYLMLGDASSLPWLVGPMGATAMLLFALPASPLGNVLSALIGVGCRQWLGEPLVARLRRFGAGTVDDVRAALPASSGRRHHGGRGSTRHACSPVRRETIRTRLKW